MSPADVDQAMFQGIRHLHATGITPALSAGCRELAAHLMTEARQQGASISFDPNLRPSLWPSRDDMRETLNALAVKADGWLPGLAGGGILTPRGPPPHTPAFTPG